MAIGTNVLWSPLKHIIWHPGELLNYRYTLGARELWQMGIWSYLDGTWHQCCGALSNTLHLTLWGTMELQIYTRCQGTMANGAMKLFRWHLAPVLWSSNTLHLASGELWNYRHTKCQDQTHWYLTLVSCGAFSNTLEGTGPRWDVKLSQAHWMVPGSVYIIHKRWH